MGIIIKECKTKVKETSIGEGYLSKEEYLDMANKKVSFNWGEIAINIEDVYYSVLGSDKERESRYEEYMSNEYVNYGYKLIDYKLEDRVGGKLVVDKERVIMFVSPRIIGYFREDGLIEIVYKRVRKGYEEGWEMDDELNNEEYGEQLLRNVEELRGISDSELMHYLRQKGIIMTVYNLKSEDYIYGSKKDELIEKLIKENKVCVKGLSVLDAKEIKKAVEKRIKKKGIKGYKLIDKGDRVDVERGGETIQVIYGGLYINLKTKEVYSSEKGKISEQLLDKVSNNYKYNIKEEEEELMRGIIKGYEKVEGILYKIRGKKGDAEGE